MKSAEELLAMGINFNELGDLPRAERHYRKVLDTQPTTGGALNALGVLASQLNRHHQAIDYYNRALAASPFDVSIHFNLGLACLAAGKPVDAVNAYRQVLRLDPRAAQAH